MSYTDGFKARMVKRMAGPEGISANALGEEVGVPQGTLSRWLRLHGSRSLKPMKAHNRTGGRTRTAKEKLHIVLQASQLSEAELGAFLRREGIHEAQLKEWTEAATAALTGTSRRSRRKPSPEVKRIRALEKDLHRKEKALAEVTALLVLKKKLEALMGDEDDGTSTRSGT